jgi:hypothetical protein
MNSKDKNVITRKTFEPPPVVEKKGWRYHHLGIPTNIPRSDERYLKDLKMYVSGFEISPFGIEWMRFDPDCEISELIKTVPHIAFEVNHLESALEDLDIIAEISSPSEGIRVAMIVHNGAPVELIEFTGKHKDKT